MGIVLATVVIICDWLYCDIVPGAGKYGENLVDGILSYSNELNLVTSRRRRGGVVVVAWWTTRRSAKLSEDGPNGT